MTKEDLPRGQLSSIILSTLVSEDKYGYEIIEEIKTKSNGEIIIKQPSLYSSLRRMEEQSLISSYWRDSDIGGRRHYYSITDYGKKYADKWQVNSIFANNTDNNNIVDDKKTEEETSVEKVEETSAQNNDVKNNDIVLVKQESLIDSLQQKPESTEKDEQSADSVLNDSFVQYDLFSSPTLISNPSSEEFDSIKNLRNICENSQKKNELSSGNEQNVDNALSKTATDNENDKQNIVETNYINKNYSIDKKVDLKTEFLRLANKQKSFTQNFRTEQYQTEENIEELLKNNVSALDQEENNLPSIIKSINIEQPFLQRLEPTPTTKVPETVNEEHSSLDKVLEMQDSEKTDDKSANDIDEFNIEENLISKEIPKSDLQQNDEIATDTKDLMQDQGVFITEKPAPSQIPKVKRIEPSKFDMYASKNHIYNTDGVFKKIDSLYTKTHKEEIPETTVSQPTPIIDEFSTFDSLKSFYEQNDIKFMLYKKSKVVDKRNKLVMINKLKFLSSLMLLSLSMVLSLICYFTMSKFQSDGRWLYIIIPLLFIGFMSYNLVKFIKNKNSISPVSRILNYNWATFVVVGVIGVLILFSVNLLCGMPLDNILLYSNTFLYPSIVILCSPLYCLFDYLSSKIN